MLKGQAKIDYQRNYMRKRRLKGRLLDPSVRPSVQPKPKMYMAGVEIGIPELDANGHPIPEST